MMFLSIVTLATMAAAMQSSTPRPFFSHAQTSCSRHTAGDADCNDSVDMVDFEIWRKEWSHELTSKNGDFNGDGAVTIADFENWRKGYFGTSPTLTPTPTKPSAGCTYPAQVLNLTNWKLTLPIGTSKPTEILRPQLTTHCRLPRCAVSRAYLLAGNHDQFQLPPI